jgi:four helix bundle protein
MNDPVVTMQNAIDKPGLAAHSLALEAAGVAIKLVMRLPAPLKPIADQVIRSASSVPANLAEGHGRCGRDRLHFWRIAYASAREVDSHLRLLAATGAVRRSSAQAALDLFDHVRAMTWRLLNPKAWPSLLPQTWRGRRSLSADHRRWRCSRSPFWDADAGPGYDPGQEASAMHHLLLLIMVAVGVAFFFLLPWPLNLILYAPVFIAAAIAYGKALRAQGLPARTGESVMVGSTARVVKGGDGAVEVMYEGEMWRAVSTAPVAVGDEVIIQRVDGLTLRVAPPPPTSPPGQSE